jgi:HD-like signal output (HDOD) protein
MSHREEIIAAAVDLPALPLCVSRVMSLVDKPQLALCELAEVIRLDPGLTVNVLRLANSPYFNTGCGPVTNLREALFKLGITRVKQLILSSTLASRMRGEIRGYGLGPGELLRHSIAVGLGAEHLARHLDIMAPEHTFTAGLLANIGRIVMDQFLAQDRDIVLDLAKALPFEDAERAVMGIDNAELGAMVLDHWGLPKAIVNCVRWHLNPNLAPEVDIVLDLVHAGHVQACMIGMAMGLDGMSHLVCQASYERLGLTADIQALAMEDLVTDFANLEDLFQSQDAG